MDTISLDARRRRRAVEPVRTGIGVAALVGRWLSRARSRRHLRLVLDDPRVLADLGLTPEEADLESLKPFWR
jgi:uncharacterized protein YjiS (DUF1127 family)